MTTVMRGICLAALCSVFTMAGTSAGAEADPLAEARIRLYQAVEQARNENMGELSRIVLSMRKKDSPYSRIELQPDYLSLLKEQNGYVQLLAVQSLTRFKNAATRDALCEYLKTRDYDKLQALTRGAPAGVSSEAYSIIECMAVSAAVLTLGELGDESVIPVLSDLRDDVTWETEWTGRPVEHALGKLGAVQILASTPPDAEEKQLDAAAGAISRIQDPKHGHELMAVARDGRVQERFRYAALSALGRFNAPDVARLLITIMNDPNAPVSLRKRAALSAGQTGDRTAEASVLVHANDPRSPVRTEAFLGLVLGLPDKYLASWFDTMMDPDEDLAFRRALIGWDQYIPRDVLRSRKEDLYSCLQAAEPNGRPIDEIRVAMWCMICDLFGEEPTLVLAAKTPSATARIRSVLERRVLQSNTGTSFANRRALVDEKIDRLVTVYDRSDE